MRAPWDPPEETASAPPPPPAPVVESILVSPCPSPGCSGGCDTRYWPGMDDVVPGYYGGKTLIVPHAHLWHEADLWGQFVSFCGIVLTKAPAPITDPKAVRCDFCATCPTDRRRARTS